MSTAPPYTGALFNTPIPLLLTGEPFILAGAAKMSIPIRGQVTHGIGGGGACQITVQVLEGNLPLPDNQNQIMLGFNTADDLSNETVTINSIQSQDLVNGIIVLTVAVDTLFNGNCAGEAIFPVEYNDASLAGSAPTQVVAVPENALGVSWDYESGSGDVTSLQLQGALNVSGPFIDVGAEQDGANDGGVIASLPAGVNFLRVFNSASSHATIRIQAF